MADAMIYEYMLIFYYMFLALIHLYMQEALHLQLILNITHTPWNYS